MKTVLFACVHNAGRSQMAAAWLNELADPRRACAISAGTQPGSRVHPEVVDAMREVGIELSRVAPQLLSYELARTAELLITMGCGDACPVVPGLRRDDWPLEDPKGKPLPRVREIREDIRARVTALLRAEGWGGALLSVPELQLEPLQAREVPAALDLLERTGLPQAGVRETPEAFVAAKRGDRLIGCGGVEAYAPHGLLRSVAVDPAERERGIAAALVQHLAQRSRLAGLEALYLLTTSAREYFARLGFEPCARDTAPAGIRSSWEFRSGCPATAVLMRRALG